MMVNFFGGGGLRVGMLPLPVTVANKGFEGSLVRSLLSMYCSHPGSNGSWDGEHTNLWVLSPENIMQS